MSHREVALSLFRLQTAIDSLVAPSSTDLLAAVPGSARTSIIALLVALCYFAGSQIGFLLTPASTPDRKSVV